MYGKNLWIHWRVYTIGGSQMTASTIRVGNHWYGVIKDGETVVWKSVPHTSGKMALEEAKRRLAHPGKSLAGVQKQVAKWCVVLSVGYTKEKQGFISTRGAQVGLQPVKNVSKNQTKKNADKILTFIVRTIYTENME
jgi:hypothetical protein